MYMKIKVRKLSSLIFTVIFALSAVQAIHAAGVTGTIPVGTNPFGIAYDSGKGEVFVTNYGSNTVSVISDSTNAVVATVSVGTEPFGVAYDSGKGEVFVTNYGSTSVSVISDSANTVVATVFVGSIPLGVAYDSGKGEIFVANEGSSTVSVISDSNNTVVATVPVGIGPRDVAYDSGRGEVFVPSPWSNTVSVISDSTNTVVKNVTVGSEAWGVAYDSSKGEVFVTNYISGAVSVISDSTNAVVATVSVGTYPYAVAYDSGRGEVFVPSPWSNTVSVISDGTNTVVKNVTVGINPGAVAYDSGKSEVFVTNYSSNTVSVISDHAALVAPSVSSSPTTVYQGQTSSLTSTAVTTGVAPYKYQWFSEAPGVSSYSSIGGATSSSYSFLTSTSTATGIWSFILQVTDNTGAAVNSTAAKVTVQWSTSLAWPMFHDDLGHLGYSTSTAPKTNQILWEYTTGGAVASSPAVVNSVVYVGSDDNCTYALNASTGVLVWKYATGGAVRSSPAVSNGVVFISSQDDSVYALSAATGALVWKYTTGGIVWSSPVVANGVVYVGSYDDNVYALNASTGVLVWKYRTGDVVYSSPAVANGVVYVGSHDDNVYALNASTGALVWRYTTGWYVYSSPAVANGVVYVGSDDNCTYALNASTGVLVWRYRTGLYVSTSSPAVVNGVVYVGSDDNCTYALNASTGVLVWKYATGSYVTSSPAIADDILFIGSWDDNVYALNASTGALVWKYTTGGIVWSSPAVANDVVYVGSYDDNVYAFGTRAIYIMPDGSISPSSANITNSGNVTYAFTGNNYLPIVVNRSNVIINGMGYTLQTSGGISFSLRGMKNVTIKDTTITKGWVGILLYSSYGNVLSGNNFANIRNASIALVSGDDNTLSCNNVAANSGYGIVIESSSDGNVLSGNNITADSYGIYLDSSYSNMIFHNNFLNNTEQTEVFNSTNTWDNGYPSGGNYWSDYQTRYPSAAEIDGSGIWNTPYVIDANNTDRYPLMTPWSSVEERATPAGKNVVITYATGTVVTFSNVTSSGVTTLSATQPPTSALSAAPNSVFVSLQTNATYHGNVTLSFKYNPAGLTLADQMAMRMWVWNTASNTWQDITTYVNTTIDTVYGVSPHLSCIGISCTLSLLGSNGQTVQTVVQTPISPPAGLPTSLEALAYYNITATTPYTPPVTIRLAYNTSAITPEQALFLQMWLWNTTSNTWAEIPTRVDTADSVVIGISPHLCCIGITCQQPFPAGVAMVGASCSKTVVGKGYNVAISVQIQNQGSLPQSFTAFIYANSTVIYSEPISSLAPQASTNVTFEFTASLAYGNYSVSACGQPIKWVRVTIPGDINGDGVVNGKDLHILATYWLETVPPAPANVDIGGYGIISGKDLHILAENWLVAV
jgi:YVTN family beta-propeller protein/parallel beta-helix repeat protein